MTAEVSKTEATKSRPEPAYRKPTQTRAGRLRKQMIADFVAKAGGNDRRVSPIVMQNITRAVDLMMLASTARADLAAGKTTINDVVKLEGAADRAVRRLNLRPPNAAAPMDLHDIVAKRSAERAKAQPVEEDD
jgi:hypothetical protein